MQREIPIICKGNPYLYKINLIKNGININKQG